MLPGSERGNSTFGSGGDLHQPHLLHPLKSLAGFHEEHVPYCFVPVCRLAALFSGGRWGDAGAESKWAAEMQAVGRPGRDAWAEAAPLCPHPDFRPLSFL